MYRKIVHTNFTWYAKMTCNSNVDVTKIVLPNHCYNLCWIYKWPIVERIIQSDCFFSFSRFKPFDFMNIKVIGMMFFCCLKCNMDDEGNSNKIINKKTNLHLPCRSRNKTIHYNIVIAMQASLWAYTCVFFFHFNAFINTIV